LIGADQLIADGVKSISDLKKIKWFSKLPESAQIFLKYSPERKIPHDHMIKLQPIITGFPFAQVMMVGSFRRETSFSRDFDVMLISDNPSHLIDYEVYLSKSFNGKTYRYSSGADKISFLIEIPKKILKTETNIVYKFDIFRTPKSQKYAMLLYATGSKLFNIRMRSYAKKMGYLLNQEGLFDTKTKKQIPIRSEKGFFTALKMPYLEPKDRN
jgi:DNA polymerase/3'-5' exonuclease PolX